MSNPYEFLARWKDDGTFSGGHTIRRDPVTGRLSEPLPIGKDTEFPWSAIAAELNAGFLALNASLGERVAELEAALVEPSEEITALRAQVVELTAARDALASEAVRKDGVLVAVREAVAAGDAETVDRLAKEYDASAKERAIAEKKMEAARIADELAALEAKEGQRG